MVLRPLPVRDPATLVRFQRLSPKAYASVLPYPEMAFFREHATTLSTVLAWTPSTLRMDHEQSSLKTQFVTANFFSELGAEARLGRVLDPARDETNGAEPVAVLSYAFWQNHLGADPSLVGKTIRLNDKPVTVVGVVSSEFSGLSLESPELWLPISQHPYLVSGSKLLTEYAVEGSGVAVWGRLRPGLTPKAAEKELRLQGIPQSLATLYSARVTSPLEGLGTAPASEMTQRLTLQPSRAAIMIVQLCFRSAWRQTEPLVNRDHESQPPQNLRVCIDYEAPAFRVVHDPPTRPFLVFAHRHQRSDGRGRASCSFPPLLPNLVMSMRTG